MHRELPFDPFPFISGSHPQTIIGSFLNWHSEPSSITRLIPLSDGDKIAIEVTTPHDWKPTNRTVIMVHGLCGSHRSGYLVRMTKRLTAKGMRCVRFNMRGCGTGRGHAKQIFHSGRSEDLLQVMEALKKEEPESPIIIMGFSLGANIVLKLAGELNEKAIGVIEQFIAVSPPADLFLCVKYLNTRKNRFYEKYFVRLLKMNVRMRHELFPDLPKIDLPKDLTIYEFDELYTAPQSGFKNAMEYYEKCSSKNLIPHIKVPCRILFSEDDPLICSTTLDDLNLPDNVHLYKSKRGGHMGFLATPGKGRDFHWMDQQLEAWILDPESK